MAYNDFEQDVIRLGRQLSRYEARYKSFFNKLFQPFGYRDFLRKRARYLSLSERCAAVYGTKWDDKEMAKVEDVPQEVTGVRRLWRSIGRFFGFYQTIRSATIREMERHMTSCEEAKTAGEEIPEWNKDAYARQVQRTRRAAAMSRAQEPRNQGRSATKESKVEKKRDTSDPRTKELSQNSQKKEDESVPAPVQSVPQEPATPVVTTPPSTPTAETKDDDLGKENKNGTPSVEEEMQVQPDPLKTVSPPSEEMTNNEPENKPKQQEEPKEVTLPIAVRPNREVEFTDDPKIIINNEAIALSNDPTVLHNFLNDPKNSTLRESTKDYLAHRIYRLVTMAERAKTPAQSDLKPLVYENEDGERTVMLRATQPRPQKTGNGCWSVSLQTQLNYRGAKIDQEDIRSYRPDGTKQSIELDLTAKFLNANEVNSIGNYSTLINQFLPNTVLHTVGYGSTQFVSRDEKETFLREVIHKALEEHNSPVSFVDGVHYSTIVGMKGDTIYYKDPLQGNKRGEDSDTTLEMSIEQLMNKSQLQLSWLQDLEADLGGNVKDMNGYAGGGVNYSGGVYSDVSYEETVFNKTYTIREANRLFKAEGGEQKFNMSSNYPVTLSYKRNPAQMTGFAYNMDALEQMRLELKKLSVAGKERGEESAVYTSLDALTEKLEGFVSGKAEIDYEKMYGVAKDYKTLADIAAKENVGDGDALSRALGKHLQQVRGALDAHLHYDNRQLGFPNRWPDRGSTQYHQLEQGLAGMIAASNIKAVEMKNENWLKGYEPKNVITAKNRLLSDVAFQNMMTKLDQSIEQDRNKNIAAEERSAVKLCQSACGGDSRALIRAYNKEFFALKERGQVGPQQEKAVGEMNLAMEGDAPQKNNGATKPKQI